MLVIQAALPHCYSHSHTPLLLRAAAAPSSNSQAIKLIK